MRDDHGPRSLQGDQRHARPSHGRPLLQEVSSRLRAALRDSDTVARLGGDEFGVLLPSVSHPEDAAAVAQQLLAHLREPFVLDGMRLEIDASIGIALYPTHGEDNETLQQRADIAMYSAKQAGRGYAMFEPELDRHSPRRLALAGGLRSAINEGQIRLYYQPKADLRTGRIMGCEALARWDHPEFGIVGPSEFVPIAEQTGLITPLTSFVLEEAIKQVREWRDSGLELSVAVNLSARSFLDTQLAVEIPRLLNRWGVEAELLELEITESMLMTDPARAEATLARLSQIGLTLSVDDFGTGYSSLANLKRLPVDVIKIDKSFVIEMAVDASDAAIVRSTIELAHNLGLQRRRRGRRVRGRLAPPRGARLRLRPGLLPQPPAPGRGGDAPDPRARHGPRRRRPRCASSRASLARRGRRGRRRISCNDLQRGSVHRHLVCDRRSARPQPRSCRPRRSRRERRCGRPRSTRYARERGAGRDGHVRVQRDARDARARRPDRARASPPCARELGRVPATGSISATWNAPRSAPASTPRGSCSPAAARRATCALPLTRRPRRSRPPTFSQAGSAIFPVQGPFNFGAELSRFGAGPAPATSTRARTSRPTRGRRS